MHIDERTACFFSKLVKHMNVLQVCSIEQVTPSSGQVLNIIMLNQCRESMKHVVMQSVEKNE